MGESIVKVLLSQWAIIVYEIIVLAVLIFFIVWFMRQRRQQKKQKMEKLEQNKWQSFDASLRNEKRR